MARWCSANKKPILAHAATSTELGDTGRYPYFLRTIPSDDMLGRAMVTWIRTMGYHTINLFNSMDSYGQSGSRAVSLAAAQQGIRVVNNYEMSGNDDTLTRQALEMIRTTPTHVNVLFADTTP